MKIFFQAVKSIFCFFLLNILFIFNIYLINQGSGFTVPRELLFRTKAEIIKPIVAFPFILLFLFLIKRFLFPFFKKVSRSEKLVLIFLLCLVSAFSLFFTVQTNPDTGRYQFEIKYLVNQGMVAFFQNWDAYCAIDMPVLPFIYGLALKLIGEEQIAVLGVNTLLFLGILWLIYLLAKKFFDEKVALFSLLLFSTAPFVVTQAHLFLVDLGVTFFLTLSFYLLFKLIEKPFLLKAILIGLVLYIASLTKIFSIIFLAVFLVISFLWLFLKKKGKSFPSLSLAWIIMASLDLLYVYWQKEAFFNFVFLYTSPQKIISLFGPLLLFGFLLILGVFLIKKRFLKIKLSQKKINLSTNFLIVFIYLLLFLLFLFGKRSLFYLRTPFIGLNIPLALLFYISIFFALRKRHLFALSLLPWALATILVPNTMFKYQLPSYPPMIILTSFSLVSLFKNHQKQIKYLLAILAFSLSITYFFFLPMIQQHVKNNLRQAVVYANQFQPQEIVVLFLPLGDYGEMLETSLERTENCPKPPSLTDLADYYTNAEVTYQSQEEFLQNLKENKIPEVVLLVNHLDKPFQIPSTLEEKLRESFIEGPVFDQARGAGIWRVKIKLFRFSAD